MTEPNDPQAAARPAAGRDGAQPLPAGGAPPAVPPEVLAHARWRMHGGLRHGTVREPSVLAVRGDTAGLLAGLAAGPDYLGKAGDAAWLRALAAGQAGGGEVATLLLERGDLIDLMSACGQADLAELLGKELPEGFGFLAYLDTRAQPPLRVVARLCLYRGQN
jgi:hypothetical protein